MDAITFLRNKGILGEIHTKWMITFSDGSQVDLVQLFDEFAALRQPAVIGRSELLVAFLKWVGDGYDFENNAEKIVKEYIDEGN